LVLKGNEDEEVITPVRRSSRIRNQVTSPWPTNQKQFLIDVLSSDWIAI
jgi:hypothetical protein